MKPTKRKRRLVEENLSLDVSFSVLPKSSGRSYNK